MEEMKTAREEIGFEKDEAVFNKSDVEVTDLDMYLHQDRDSEFDRRVRRIRKRHQRVEQWVFKKPQDHRNINTELERQFWGDRPETEE